MKTMFPLTGALTIILAFGSQAFCQGLLQIQPTQAWSYSTNSGTGLELLYSSHIREELEIVDEQWEQLQALQNEMRKGYRDLYAGWRDLSADERQQRMKKIREKTEAIQAEIRKKASNILLPQQLDRIKQIRLQTRLRGASGTGYALSQGELADALGISDEQRKQLAKVRADAEKEMREKMAQLQREAQEKVLGVLTAKQRKKLDQLTGKKYDWPQRQQARRVRPSGQ